jgi:hypothetical protein
MGNPTTNQRRRSEQEAVICARGKFRYWSFALHRLDKEPLGMRLERSLSHDLLVKGQQTVTVLFDGEARDGPENFAQEVHHSTDVVEDLSNNSWRRSGTAMRAVSERGLYSAPARPNPTAWQRPVSQKIPDDLQD